MSATLETDDVLSIRDLTDVDRVLEATRELYEMESAGVPGSRARIGDLVLARESSANDYLEIEGLIAQAASLYSEIDGIEAVAALGIEPLRTSERTLLVQMADPASGEESLHPLHLERLEVGKAKGVLFSFRGTAYLYSLTSAAKVDELGHQDWTRMLIRVICRLRPHRLRAVSVSRYTRNLEVAGLLLHAASRHVDQIWAGPLELQMRGTRAPMDKLLFTMLAMAAALERDALVSRMVAGKVNAARRNQWLAGARSVPPGYELVEKTLVPVAADRPLVQAMLTLIVSRPTAMQFVVRAGELGLRLRPLADADAEGRSVAYTSSPGSKLDSFLALLPLYATGQKVVKLPNPFPGAKHFADIPVVCSADGREEVHIVSTFGVPEGGWADQALLDAALAVAIERSERANIVNNADLLAGLDDPETHAMVATAMEARRAAPPKAPESTLWSGVRWSSGDTMWQLVGRGVDSMELLRYPTDLAPPADPSAEAADFDGLGDD